MARDIEEFLRRAAERRKQQQQKQQPAQPRKIRRVVEPEEIEIVDPIQVVQPARRKPVRKVQQQTRTRPKSLRDQSVSEHVSQHIDTTDVSEHAEHLGERIQQADDVISQRIQQKFDHEVGRLEDMPTVQDDAVPSVAEDQSSKLAADLLRMLSRPESVRQAILISEILNRPDFD